MAEKNVKGEVLVYDFWAYDVGTDVAKETLEELGVPFRVETKRRLRDRSAPEGCKYDEWAEIYVDVEKLVKWIEAKIEEEINSY